MKNTSHSITDSGCIGEIDGFSANIDICQAEPGKYVLALIDQKTKERGI
jgi:hypothetical protein